MGHVMTHRSVEKTNCAPPRQNYKYAHVIFERGCRYGSVWTSSSLMLDLNIVEKAIQQPGSSAVNSDVPAYLRKKMRSGTKVDPMLQNAEIFEPRKERAISEWKLPRVDAMRSKRPHTGYICSLWGD